MENEKYNSVINDFIDNTVDSIKNIKHIKNIASAVNSICSCEGKIIVTGMGKNGHIAKKIASTFCSLSTPSCFLHPGEAMHGDSGVMDKKDILLALSTSGKTKEILETINVGRKIGISKIISITSHEDSLMKKDSDIVIEIGSIKESGYLGIAPTTSTCVILVIGDLLATLVAKIKNTNYFDYSIRHHGGYLGEISRDRANFN
jgi:arabinose-5-phosphate isomerase